MSANWWESCRIELNRETSFWDWLTVHVALMINTRDYIRMYTLNMRKACHYGIICSSRCRSIDWNLSRCAKVRKESDQSIMCVYLFEAHQFLINAVWRGCDMYLSLPLYSKYRLINTRHQLIQVLNIVYCTKNESRRHPLLACKKNTIRIKIKHYLQHKFRHKKREKGFKKRRRGHKN